MDAKTAEQNSIIKFIYAHTDIVVGITLGILICITIALGFCFVIIIEQDALIHQLLLTFSNVPAPK